MFSRRLILTTAFIALLFGGILAPVTYSIDGRSFVEKTADAKKDKDKKDREYKRERKKQDREFKREKDKQDREFRREKDKKDKDDDDKKDDDKDS